MAGYDNNTYPDDPDPNNDTYSGIRSAYKNYLGRDASDEEVKFHYNTSPDNYNDVIKNSTEAQQWTSRQNQPSAPQAQMPPSGGGDNQAVIDGFWGEWKADSKPRSKAELDALIAKYPAIKRLSDDKIQLPNGQVLDALGNYNPQTGMGTAEWTISGGQPGENGQGSGAGGSGAGTGASSYPAGGGQRPNDPMRDQLVAQLMKRSQQSLNVDPNDPIIKGQGDAYNASLERERQRYLSGLAESNGPYGNNLGEARLTQEQVGQDTGKFVSGLMGTEVSARRKEIQDALTSLQGQLTAEQEMALRRELAQLSDATQRYGIDSSASTAANSESMRNQQFLAQLGLQAEDQYNHWDLVRSGQLAG